MLLAFPDRVDDGSSYPVFDPSGAVVARIYKRLGSQFEAADATGALLCAGGLRVLGPWVAVDPAGTELVSISRGVFGVHTAQLQHGAVQGVLRGAAFTRRWSMEDQAGTVVMEAVPHNAGFLFAPDAWLVSSLLTLAETVAVVELHRLDVKRRRRRRAD